MSTELAPAAPPSAPTPIILPDPTPAGPTAIPDGDPAAAALALLHAARPDASRILAGRIDRVEAELADQVEAARLDGRIALREFLEHAGRRLKLRAALLSRAGTPSADPPAVAVLALARSVRRWRPAEELRAERSRIIPRLRAELDRIEGSIRYLCSQAAAGSDLSPPPGEHHRTGLAHSHDGFLQRCEALLKSRQTIRDRLARLDGQGDAGRAAAVRLALESAGGVDAVAEALAPSMASPAADELARVRRDIEGLFRQIAGTDPETRLAAELSARKATAEARADELRAPIARQRAEAAGALVAGALTGRLESIAALEATAREARPELAAALGGLRGDDAELAAVVEELIAPRA